ncbi:MAG: hypothetical protein U0165_15100 [Polyangiaceae bacterium]
MTQIDSALQSFSADDYSVRLVHALFKVLPMAPTMASYSSLDDAVQQLYPQATPPVFARARELADGAGVKNALWMANLIDTADESIAAYSGLKSAFSFFFGDRSNALETDSQQGVDAGLKLLGLSYIIYELFPGGLTDKVQLFYTAPAGQAIATFFASVEVALPFADNALTAGGGMVGDLWNRYGSTSASKLAGFAGAGQLQSAQGMVSSLLGPIDQAVKGVAPYARNMAESIRPHLPGAMGFVDAAAGMVGTAADALPIYRYLGARLAAESCVLVASRGQ